MAAERKVLPRSLLVIEIFGRKMLDYHYPLLPVYGYRPEKHITDPVYQHTSGIWLLDPR
jgi:hypothetical protein